MSEVSDVEVSLWQEYRDQGLVVWAIGPSDSMEDLIAYRDDMGLTFPVLYDEDGAVFSRYEQQAAFSQTIFPQDWIIDAEGRVAYVNNAYEADEMIAIIEGELGL